MRILLANKYFFPNGGTEIFLKILMDQAPRLGHECIPFSVAYQGNWPSPYSDYFLPALAGTGAARLEQMRLTPAAALALLERSIYSFSAKRGLTRLLDAHGPFDAALAVNIYNYMSPSIFHTLAKRGVPIAVFLGDYHLMCANYQFMREDKPCFLCQTGAYWHGARHRCVKGSLAASCVRVLSMYVQRWLKLWDLPKVFLSPCAFMRDQLAQAGIPKKKLRVLRYPIPAPDALAATPKSDAILYFGRISREKGLDTLILAYQALAPKADLIILGRDYDGELDRLQALIRPEFRDRIRFPGFADRETLARAIASALVTVVPSRWHDNAPLSVYESQILGTPVLAAAMGGIPEQIRDGVDGALFASGSVADLAAKLEAMLADRTALAAMGASGRARVRADNDPLTIARELMDILASLAEQRPRP